MGKFETSRLSDYRWNWNTGCCWCYGRSNSGCFGWSHFVSSFDGGLRGTPFLRLRGTPFLRLQGSCLYPDGRHSVCFRQHRGGYVLPVTVASKSKEGSASQASIETTDKVTPPETTTTAATTTTTITPTTTSVPIPTVIT